MKLVFELKFYVQIGEVNQSKAFIDFCEKKSIKQQLMQARTPQQNGVVEWKNHTLLEKVYPRFSPKHANFLVD
jgi:transposase InsO family protein